MILYINKERARIPGYIHPVHYKCYRFDRFCVNYLQKANKKEKYLPERVSSFLPLQYKISHKRSPSHSLFWCIKPFIPSFSRAVLSHELKHLISFRGFRFTMRNLFCFSWLDHRQSFNIMQFNSINPMDLSCLYT